MRESLRIGALQSLVGGSKQRAEIIPYAKTPECRQSHQEFYSFGYPEAKCRRLQRAGRRVASKLEITELVSLPQLGTLPNSYAGLLKTPDPLRFSWVGRGVP